MKKSTYLKVVIALTVSNIIWAFAFAIVGDFYPHLETTKNVLGMKTGFNGFILIMSLIVLPMMMDILED